MCKFLNHIFWIDGVMVILILFSFCVLKELLRKANGRFITERKEDL